MIKHLPDGMRLRWLGHATFEVFGPDEQKFLFDPFIVHNPAFPKELGGQVTAPGAYDALLVSHPHFDHFSDVLPLLRDDPALKIICQFDIGDYLKSHGIGEERIVGINTGGTTTFRDVRVTMVQAVHSSSVDVGGDGRSLGFPVGFVLRFANGFAIYYTGDTAVTMDMKIVHDLYKPDLVILPIGDFYTMGAEQAAYALNLLKPRLALGVHWGTWNGLPPGTPEALEKELARYRLHTHLIKLKPGETLT